MYSYMGSDIRDIPSTSYHSMLDCQPSFQSLVLYDQTNIAKVH